MTIGERIRILRKSLPDCKTLEAFGKRVGLTPSAISQAETGKNGVAESLIRNICREFKVNETWLRTGEGEMFQTVPRYEEISLFFGDLLKDQPDFRHKFIKSLASMSVDEWALLEHKIREITAEDEKKPDSQ